MWHWMISTYTPSKDHQPNRYVENMKKIFLSLITEPNPLSKAGFCLHCCCVGGLRGSCIFLLNSLKPNWKSLGDHSCCKWSVCLYIACLYRLHVLWLSLGPLWALFHWVLLPAGPVLPQLQTGGPYCLLPHVPEQTPGPRRGCTLSSAAKGRVWVHRQTPQNPTGCIADVLTLNIRASSDSILKAEWKITSDEYDPRTMWRLISFILTAISLFGLKCTYILVIHLILTKIKALFSNYSFFFCCCF